MLGVVTLAKAAQYLTLPSPERGLNLRRFALRFVGAPATSSRGMSTFFCYKPLVACLFLQSSLESVTGDFPNSFLNGEGQILSICVQGMWASEPGHEGPLFLASVSRWSLNSPREDVGSSLFLRPPSDFPLQRGLGAASSGSPRAAGLVSVLSR